MRKKGREGKPYKLMSNSEILMELKDSCDKYTRIYKSIPIADIILDECGLPRCKYKSDMREKNRHDKLYKIAMDRKLKVPQEWYDVKISSADVLERIKTAYYEYIESLTRKSQVYVSDALKTDRHYSRARVKACDDKYVSRLLSEMHN